MIITRYTMVHGQCLTVGVGGFILGGGENEQLINVYNWNWLSQWKINDHLQESMPWVHQRDMAGVQKMFFKCGWADVFVFPCLRYSYLFAVFVFAADMSIYLLYLYLLLTFVFACCICICCWHLYLPAVFVFACWLLSEIFPQVVLADGRVARVTSRSALVENENGTRSEYRYTHIYYI